MNPSMPRANAVAVRDGLRRVRQAVHHGGHTTIADMAFALFDQDREWEALCDVLDREDTPFRVHMVPRVQDPGSAGLECEVARVRALLELNTARLAFHDHVKLFSDGGFFAELMQVQPPGFIDGHHGEWLMAPERFEALARAFWNEGYHIHAGEPGGGRSGCASRDRRRSAPALRPRELPHARAVRSGAPRRVPRRAPGHRGSIQGHRPPAASSRPAIRAPGSRAPMVAAAGAAAGIRDSRDRRRLGDRLHRRRPPAADSIGCAKGRSGTAVRRLTDGSGTD